MRRHLKHFISTYRPLLRLMNWYTGDFPKVLVYHRFAHPGANMPHRVNAKVFAWQLDTIMKDFEVISLEKCIASFSRNNRWPQGCVVLTIDDGYHDMYEMAWPELAKRKLPATLFVTTGFIDGDIWLWPDRLEYALRETTCTECTIVMADKNVLVSLNNFQERSIAWKKFSDYCISLKNIQRLAFIKQVEELLSVELPSVPTHAYSAVTWEQLREMQAGGIEIGGHTMTHPILSKIEVDLLNREIGLCRRILQKRLYADINNFCYPNSGPDDINDTVIDAVCQAGYSGAVFGTNLADWDRYRIPRMGISNDSLDFLWKLYGGEFLACKVGRTALTK